MKFLNIRGPNGSGKTRLLRELVLLDGLDRLETIHQPVYPEGHIKAGKRHGGPVVATITKSGLALIGDYGPLAQGTTAGLDKVPTQADAKASAIAASKLPGVVAVLFEGVVVSTIFQGWADFSDSLDEPMVWVFLDTPLDVCLARIQARNGGKPINEALVADKVKSIDRVREKANIAGFPVAIMQPDEPERMARQLRTLAMPNIFPLEGWNA